MPNFNQCIELKTALYTIKFYKMRINCNIHSRQLKKEVDSKLNEGAQDQLKHVKLIFLVKLKLRIRIKIKNKFLPLF